MAGMLSRLPRARRPDAAFRIWQRFAIACVTAHVGLLMLSGLGSAIGRLLVPPAEEAAVQAAWAMPLWLVLASCVIGSVCLIGLAVVTQPWQIDILPGVMMLAFLVYGLVTVAIAGIARDPSGLLYTWGREPINFGWHWLGSAVIVPVCAVASVRLTQLYPRYRALLVEEAEGSRERDV